MSHIRYIAPQPQDCSKTHNGTYPESTAPKSLLLRNYDCHWEDRWQDALRNLKAATKAYDAACDERTEPSLVERLKSVLTQRELEIHWVFLSGFRTTDEYAEWRLSILDLELRWLSGRPHKMAPGLPMVEIIRRLDEVRVYALGPPLSGPSEPPLVSRRIVSDILEQSPTPGTVRMAARLRRQGGDDALRSAIG